MSKKVHKGDIVHLIEQLWRVRRSNEDDEQSWHDGSMTFKVYISVF